MVYLKRFFTCIVCAVLLLSIGMVPSAHALEDDGVIRVLLTRLQLTDQLKVHLDGSYSIGSLAFQRGSEVIFSCESGSIMLYYEGLSADMGTSLTMLRHQDPDAKENGFRANGSYYLHPGDLLLSVRDGQLRAILRAPVEEYLLGVVPYEMSDSFPLEALKAQAITARTYALRKKQAAADSDYDVVDNTNDQAYYGIQWENENAIRAVRETAGQCGMYKKRLAECFYSASNGGQTELVHHVWGSGDYGYITMTDDPYDLENSASVVKTYRIPKAVKTNSALGVLQDMLLLSVSEQMESLGFDGDVSNIRITSVDGLRATTPKYADSPSRLMTRMYFTLAVEGRKYVTPANRYQEEDVSIFSTPVTTATPQATPAPTATLSDFIPVSEPVYVDLPIFPNLESMMGLDINAGVDNELISIRETETDFVVESRRYGHGVGMSQRGAENMAKNYDWTCDQILRFYYPGMDIGKVTYTGSEATPLPHQFLATPGPAATPTPRPTLMPATSALADGQFKVIVNQIGVNSYLNLRQQPNTVSPVVHQLYYGQELIVTEDLGEWLQVKTDAVQGYVMAQYVEKITNE